MSPAKTASGKAAPSKPVRDADAKPTLMLLDGNSLAFRAFYALPAENFKLKNRGCLDAGCYADLVVFDPATIADHSTFAKPHQYATGVVHVFVNGVQVLKDGEHTGATPGQVVRGPGYRPVPDR